MILGGVLFILFYPGRPNSKIILTHMERVYGKKFQIIEEFTYISYTDGEPDVQQELKCPAVKLQDVENHEIQFTPIEKYQKFLNELGSFFCVSFEMRMQETQSDKNSSLSRRI